MRIRKAEEFPRGLGGGVRRERLVNTIVLGEWHLTVDAVHARRRSKDELRNAVLPCQFEQVQRTVHICLGVKLWLSQTRPDTGTRGQMDDHVKMILREERLHRRPIANVGVDNAIIRRLYVPGDIGVLDLGRVKVVKVVNNSYLPTVLGQQPVD